MRRKRLGGLAAAVFLLVSSTAGARSVRDEPYSLETTWNAAMRLVRVDLGMPITERDQDLGYFTFSYREGRRVVPGSMELVRTEVDGRPGARIIVQIPEMPSYVESMILARLTRKLHSEFGEPPPVQRRPAPPAAPPEFPADHPGEPSTPGNAPSAAAPPQTPAGSAENNARPSEHINAAGPEVRRGNQPQADDD